MSSSEEKSKVALEQIKELLSSLNHDHVWDLINYIRDYCCVLIPVWFTIPLVQEISHVDLTEEQAIDIIESVNDNDLSYTLGREVVETFLNHYIETNIECNPESESDKDVK
jgi:hypothetical protein